jgi:hypothetical protein
VVGGTILKTTNGGTSWVSQSSGAPADLYSVYFPTDAQTGYAVGDYGSILKTTDGGGIWASESSGTNNGLYSVCFPTDAQTGYATGVAGTILKTTDGGGVFVEDDRSKGFEGQGFKVFEAIPNPFVAFVKIPGQEGKRFEMFNVIGRRVGLYLGDRVGWDLGPGVYFLKPEGKNIKTVRVVKVR